MELFLQFVITKWYLFAAAASLLALLAAHESRKGAVALTPAQLTLFVNQKGAAVIDLRDGAEFRQGHIVDSINIPHAKLIERIAELGKYRTQSLILVCKIGQHSGAIAKTLKEKGFPEVYRLQGGIQEWQGSQLPLVRS